MGTDTVVIAAVITFRTTAINGFGISTFCTTYCLQNLQ